MIFAHLVTKRDFKLFKIINYLPESLLIILSSLVLLKLPENGDFSSYKSILHVNGDF